MSTKLILLIPLLTMIENKILATDSRDSDADTTNQERIIAKRRFIKCVKKCEKHHVHANTINNNRLKPVVCFNACKADSTRKR